VTDFCAGALYASAISTGEVASAIFPLCRKNERAREKLVRLEQQNAPLTQS
jgi:hypothetical protein